jgi:hypothetical protein
MQARHMVPTTGGGDRIELGLGKGDAHGTRAIGGGHRAGGW